LDFPGDSSRIQGARGKMCDASRIPARAATAKAETERGMKTSTTYSEPMLSSLLFCSALGAWGLSGCSAKLDGYVPMGGDTGGSTSLQNTLIGGNGSGGTTSASGSTVVSDPSSLSTGESNQVSTGGYWWTYTDHQSVVSQYHATISPTTNMFTALMPSKDIDSNHGNVLRIVGKVPGSLSWILVAEQDPLSIDTYWQSVYPDSMIWDYPAAGIGFSFLPRNAPFDATGGGQWVGIAFDMKTNVDTPTVWVSMPTVATDLPDPNMMDAFPKQCRYFTLNNAPVDGAQTCFAHYRMGIFSDAYQTSSDAFNTLAPVGEWKRYCVLYSEVARPSWASVATLEALKASPFDPTQLLKVQWDMYQPAAAANAAAFDVGAVPDLLTESQVRSIT
jgi:hypothetical protein